MSLFRFGLCKAGPATVEQFSARPQFPEMLKGFLGAETHACIVLTRVHRVPLCAAVVVVVAAAGAVKVALIEEEDPGALCSVQILQSFFLLPILHAPHFEGRLKPSGRFFSRGKKKRRRRRPKFRNFAPPKVASRAEPVNLDPRAMNGKRERDTLV